MYYNFGLIGFPLSHTLSPIIHNYFIYNNNLNGGYNCFEINDVKKLGDLIKFLNNYKFSGLNITLPYKEEIKKYVDEFSEDALKIGSINTLSIKQNCIKGYNTDTFGFKEMLRYNRISLTNRTVVLLGSGGAARSALSIILEENPRCVYIVCRNTLKGDVLLKDLKTDHAKNIAIKDMSILKKTLECDVIINATSAGIIDSFNIDLGSVHVNYCAIDLQYILNSFTHFLHNFKKQKIILLDGLDMLIFQALRSFEIWTGKEISININVIKNKLKRTIE